MLKRSERLTREQFAVFGKQGRRFHAELATVVFSPLPSLHGAVVVSKKVAKSAVRRNRLRRQVYGQLQTAKRNGYTGVFVVILKPEAAKVTSADFCGAIRSLIERTQKPA